MRARIRTGRERRAVLNFPAVVTESDGCTVDVTIVEVSASGFRLRSLSDLEIGSNVLLQMGDTRPVRIHIRRSCGDEVEGIFLDSIAL